MENNMYNKF